MTFQAISSEHGRKSECLAACDGQLNRFIGCNECPIISDRQGNIIILSCAAAALAVDVNEGGMCRHECVRCSRCRY